MLDFIPKPIPMHPALNALATELLTFNGDRSAKPTAADRVALVDLRRRIEQVAEDPTVRAHERGEADRSFMYELARTIFAQQEYFWHLNGRKFADE